MTTSEIWRSRPVFITSTFRDMHAERDWLRTHVFPVLEERLRERFHHLETVDLRWGVDSASAAQEQDRELSVLTVCLREIERSRPFLIALLGDRYGWRPPRARITAAASEAGLDADVAGKSVTELEILHGVLRTPDQQQRSWFYLRDPLPYDAMPQAVAARYDEAHSGDPESADNADKLRALKARLASALPARVRTYAARWNTETQSVTGLESWGAQVLEDLWSDLEAETTTFLREAPRTWQEQDRWALDEFVEGRARGFVGRTAIETDLVQFATLPAPNGTSWGACVTAETGGGKSSLVGHLYRLLQQQDVLVLAHASGISVRSTQVDWMLRRWVGELASSLGQADPLPEHASSNDIDQTFSRLLHLAAQTRRVVVLIDALNQFEPTTRATHLTWMPRIWPANARLIATAIQGPQCGALLNRSGVVEKPLPPIDRGEAFDIVRGICARYHRTLNARVEMALLEKKRDPETPAFGNPLWLELATEELNLLGAEAFERADASGGEGIINLLVSVVEQMPAAIEGLYGWMLDRVEQNFGQAWTRAFTNAIAASRFGWRESDLEKLMPVLSGEPWDPLRFATLRRAFRAHIVQRGANVQWDFAHAQMRKAIAPRLPRGDDNWLHVHRAIVNYLVRLPREDPLHETETMVHLMCEGARVRAAAYYGSGLTAGEARGATSVLASLVVAHRALEVVSLLDQSIDPAHRARVGERFLFELNDALEDSAPLDRRSQVAGSAERAFNELTMADPSNAGWQRDRSVSHERVGQILMAQGNLPAALGAFQASHAIRVRLATADPNSPDLQRDVAVSHIKIGEVMASQGNLPGALAAFQAGLSIDERLVAMDPGNTDWQRDLSVSTIKVGEVLATQGNLAAALAAYQASLAVLKRLAEADEGNASRQHDLAGGHMRIGDIVRDQGNLPGALVAFQAAHRLVERLAMADPSNASWQRDLAVSHERIGDVMTAQGDLPGALVGYQTCLAISERLAAADPADSNRQGDLSGTHKKIGEVQFAQGNLSGALASHQASLVIWERLAATDPSNADWQRVSAVSQIMVGDVQRAQGDPLGALAAYQASLAIQEGLAAAHPGNAVWQRELSPTQVRIGDVLLAQGKMSGALSAYRSSLATMERLTGVDPGNAAWQRDLSVSYERIGTVLKAQRDLQGALVAYQASLAIAERLTATDSGNAVWQRDLSVSQSLIGDVLRAQGDLPNALAAYAASFVIRSRLTRADPSNKGSQQDFAMIQDKIGDALKAKGDLSGALLAYEGSRAVTERLTASEPLNGALHHTLVVSQIKIGDLLKTQGNLSGALAAYEASAAIATRSAAADRGNADWQRDLALSHDRIGDVLYAQGNPSGTLAALQASFAIRERLAAADPRNAGWQRDLAVSYFKLATHCTRTNDADAADYWRRCHAVLQGMRAAGMFLDPPLLQLLGQLDGADVPKA